MASSSVGAPRRGVAWSWRWRWCGCAGRSAAYRQALKAKPGYPEAQFNLGIALILLKKFEEAVEPLKQTVTLRPTDARAHYPASVYLGRPGMRFVERDGALFQEPRAAAPHRRLRTIEALARAGVPVGVSVSPAPLKACTATIHQP